MANNNKKNNSRGRPVGSKDSYQRSRRDKLVVLAESLGLRRGMTLDLSAAYDEDGRVKEAHGRKWGFSRPTIAKYINLGVLKAVENKPHCYKILSLPTE